MTIGLMVLTMFIEGTASLKDKRMVLRSLKERIRSRYNVSILESAHQDLWQKSELSFVLLAPTHNEAEAQLRSIELDIFALYPVKQTRVCCDFFDGVSP